MRIVNLQNQDSEDAIVDIPSDFTLDEKMDVEHYKRDDPYIQCLKF